MSELMAILYTILYLGVALGVAAHMWANVPPVRSGAEVSAVMGFIWPVTLIGLFVMSLLLLINNVAERAVTSRWS